MERGFTSPTQRDGSRHAMQRKRGSAASEHRTESSLRSLEINFIVAGDLAICCSAWCTQMSDSRVLLLEDREGCKGGVCRRVRLVCECVSV